MLIGRCWGWSTVWECLMDTNWLHESAVGLYTVGMLIWMTMKWSNLLLIMNQAVWKPYDHGTVDIIWAIRLWLQKHGSRALAIGQLILQYAHHMADSQEQISCGEDSLTCQTMARVLWIAPFHSDVCSVCSRVHACRPCVLTSSLFFVSRLPKRVLLLALLIQFGGVSRPKTLPNPIEIAQFMDTSLGTV